MRVTSCGVLVLVNADSDRLLLGRATGTRRWDIPKGVAEAGESWRDTAVRELREETSLVAETASLREIGLLPYLPRKDLALFVWRPSAPVVIAELRCTSTFESKTGRSLPEMAEFALLPWTEALARMGKSLAHTLASLDRETL